MTYLVGIVGAGRDKFTDHTAQKARDLIRKLLEDIRKLLEDARLDTGQDVVNEVTVVSGHSPMGGVDIWAETIAGELGMDKRIFAPVVQQWDPDNGYGYKARNLDICRNSDILHNIVVKEYPPGYTGFRVIGCYHCVTNSHVKSGGCWTMWQMRKTFNKHAEQHIISESD